MNSIELLNTVISSRISEVNICMPASIIEYDFKKQKARVQPALNYKYNDGSIVIIPDIFNVPVVHPASGGASITFPVSVGDNVLLLFSQKSLEEWLEKGEQVTPDDSRQNNLTDAIAIIGLMDFGKISNAKNDTDLLIKYKESEILVKKDGDLDIKATNINISGNNEVNITSTASLKLNSSSVVDLTATEIKINGILTINGVPYILHTHAGVMPGAGITGPVV